MKPSVFDLLKGQVRLNVWKPNLSRDTTFFPKSVIILQPSGVFGFLSITLIVISSARLQYRKA